MDVEPGLAAFAGLRVDLLLDFVPHFLNLEPFLSEQKRICHVLCLSFDEFTKQLVIEVVIVKDFNVVVFVVVALVAVGGRLLAQDIIGGPTNEEKQMYKYLYFTSGNMIKSSLKAKEFLF